MGGIITTPREVLAAIIDFHLAGYSSSQNLEEINKRFGTSFTRNAIIGQISRARARGEIKGETPKILVRTSVKPKPKFARFRRAPMPKITKPTCDPKLFLDLPEKGCRYELGIPGDPPKWFCGAETTDSAWCPYHSQIVYTKPYKARDETAQR